MRQPVDVFTGHNNNPNRLSCDGGASVRCERCPSRGGRRLQRAQIHVEISPDEHD